MKIGTTLGPRMAISRTLSDWGFKAKGFRAVQGLKLWALQLGVKGFLLVLRWVGE